MARTKQKFRKNKGNKAGQDVGQKVKPDKGGSSASADDTECSLKHPKPRVLLDIARRANLYSPADKGSLPRSTIDGVIKISKDFMELLSEMIKHSVLNAIEGERSSITAEDMKSALEGKGYATVALNDKELTTYEDETGAEKDISHGGVRMLRKNALVKIADRMKNELKDKADVDLQGVNIHELTFEEDSLALLNGSSTKYVLDRLRQLFAGGSAAASVTATASAEDNDDNDEDDDDDDDDE